MSLTAHPISAAPAHRSFTLVPALHPQSACAMGQMQACSTVSRSTEAANSESCHLSAGIDSIALLFQTILQEDRLTPLLRVWIARLQTPVMQQALSDPDSFEHQTHPVRRLLAHLGSSAMAHSGDALPCGALEQEIKRLVLFIEEYPDSGRQAYEQAAEEFGRFLAGFQAEPAAAQKVDCIICQKDQKQALIVQYSIALRDALKLQTVPDQIREFLFKVWTEVLAVAAVRHGLQHVDTLSLKKSAMDLISAHGAMTAQDGHSYAIRKMPLLLQRLRAGMSMAGVSVDDQDAHITTIRDALGGALLVKSGRIVSADDPMSGLEIVEDDPETTWRLWECALAEQDLNSIALPLKGPVIPAGPPRDGALKTIDQHHHRVASAIRNLWTQNECSSYINGLIMDGGDGMGNDRIGFKHSAFDAMMTLAERHDGSARGVRIQRGRLG